MSEVLKPVQNLLSNSENSSAFAASKPQAEPGMARRIADEYRAKYPYGRFDQKGHDERTELAKLNQVIKQPSTNPVMDGARLTFGDEMQTTGTIFRLPRPRQK